MRQPTPASRATLSDNRDKRFGWYRLYEGFIGHKKWRVVAPRADVHLAFVHVIVLCIFEAASKARADGYIGGFDFEEYSAATDIPVSDFAAVHRVLTDMRWLEQDIIVHWAWRNPRDATAAQRKRNQRARETAQRAIANGTATAEQIELLDHEIGVEAREAFQKIAAISRVTATPPATPPTPEASGAFVLLKPKEDTYVAQQEAMRANERAARAWLIGDGSRGLDYGVASKIVADNFGCRRMSADTTIRGWLQEEMAGDVVTLAIIISGAYEQAITCEHFRNVVERAMAEYVRERTAGPTLPLAPVAIKGGRA